MAYKTAPPLLSSSLFFGNVSTERCPGRSVQSRLCSPHLLPQSPKSGAGRGGGGASRTVTQMLLWPGGPYCHANASLICSVPKGEMLSVFFILCFLCLARCLLLFFIVLPFLGSLLRKFSGANFCFWVSVLFVCVYGAVLPMFLFYYSFFRSRNCL